MGLDITAYRQVSPAGDIAKGDDGWPADIDHYFRVTNIVDFHARAAPLQDGACYEFKDSMGFRAGSYSGYGEWRNELARLAGYLPHPAASRHPYAEGAWAASAGPFWELINFADNEGTIGSEAAARLAADFAKFDTQAMQATEPWFYKLYKAWRAAFEMAADGGAVDFH